MCTKQAFLAFFTVVIFSLIVIPAVHAQTLWDWIRSLFFPISIPTVTGSVWGSPCSADASCSSPMICYANQCKYCSDIGTNTLECQALNYHSGRCTLISGKPSGQYCTESTNSNKIYCGSYSKLCDKTTQDCCECRPVSAYVYTCYDKATQTCDPVDCVKTMTTTTTSSTTTTTTLPACPVCASPSSYPCKCGSVNCGGYSTTLYCCPGKNQCYGDTSSCKSGCTYISLSLSPSKSTYGINEQFTAQVSGYAANQIVSLQIINTKSTGSSSAYSCGGTYLGSVSCQKTISNSLEGQYSIQAKATVSATNADIASNTITYTVSGTATTTTSSTTTSTTSTTTSTTTTTTTLPHCCQFSNPTSCDSTFNQALCQGEGGTYYSGRQCCGDGTCKTTCNPSCGNTCNGLGYTNAICGTPPASGSCDGTTCRWSPSNQGSGPWSDCGSSDCICYKSVTCGSTNAECVSRCSSSGCSGVTTTTTTQPTTTTTTTTSSTTTTTTQPVCSYGAMIDPSSGVHSDTTKTWTIKITDSSSANCPSTITYNIIKSQTGSCSSVIIPSSITVIKGGSTNFDLSITRGSSACTVNFDVKDPNGKVRTTGTFTVNPSGAQTCTQAGGVCKPNQCSSYQSCTAAPSNYDCTGGNPYCCFGSCSVLTTTTTTSTTTIPSTTTTSSTTSSTTTSTTTTMPVGIQCDECYARSTCRCKLTATCNNGILILENKEGKPLEASITPSIPPTNVEFETKQSGKISIRAICFRDTTTDSYGPYILEVKEPFLDCDEECEVLKPCECRVNGCNDGYFNAVIGATIIKWKEKIDKTSYSTSLISEKSGVVDVSVACSNPAKYAEAQIPISGVTPPGKKFSASSFSSREIDGKHKLMLDFNNNLGEDVITVFTVSKEGLAMSNKTVAQSGSGTVYMIFNCKDLGVGSYQATWKVFKSSDKKNPITWSKPEETVNIEC